MKRVFVIKTKSHPLNQSPFYKIKSPRQLADILVINSSLLVKTVSQKENYIRFENDAGRPIQWPKPKLRAIKKRTEFLLERIKTLVFFTQQKLGYFILRTRTSIALHCQAKRKT